MNFDSSKLPQGGIIHVYQKYDPQRFPSPTQPPPDLVTPAFEHWLRFGSARPLTPEELARAIRLDPSQIQGLGPSIEGLLAMLKERKAKILATYETHHVQTEAERDYVKRVKRVQPPSRFRESFERAARQRQIYQFERLWYEADDDNSPFAQQLMQAMEALGAQYEVNELGLRLIALDTA